MDVGRAVHAGRTVSDGGGFTVLRGDSILWEEAFGWSDRERAPHRDTGDAVPPRLTHHRVVASAVMAVHEQRRARAPAATPTEERAETGKMGSDSSRASSNPRKTPNCEKLNDS